ncbi:type IV secretory system conjugative DNA transfer family protein, partial [Candidatus Falkowbacteria bacterium]|nr:type IV secretory system conjugative DNA transfer family protein [Candidatus Falkowbacteria bacterium]
PIIAQQTSAFNFREIMDKRKILLVSLPKGLVGELNAYLLGMILVGKLLMAALSRADMPKEERRNFFLYIDEFQNFTTNSVCQILSEARKYGLGLIIAHQYIGQLVARGDTAIKDAVFGNVGTVISFKIGSEDAEVLQKEFAPTFDAYDLINVEKFTAYIKLLISNTASRPFTIRTPWPLAGQENLELASNVRQLSRLKYGQDRSLVEAEISQRGKLNL